MLHII